MSARLLLLLISALFSSGAQSGITLLADPSDAHQSFSMQLEEMLNPLENSHARDLHITIGPHSLDAALQQPDQAPILALLITRKEFEQRLQNSSVSELLVTAIFREQPLDRLIALTALTLPSIHHIGILQSGEVESFETTTQQDKTITWQTTQQFRTALKQVLSDSDALITHHDPLLFNAKSFRSILLSAYRQQKPLICHTASAVRAGCVAGLSTTTEEMIEQTLKWVSQFNQGEKSSMDLFSPRYPTQYSVVTNPKVARSLGIHLDHPSTLTQQLQQIEETLQ